MNLETQLLIFLVGYVVTLPIAILLFEGRSWKPYDTRKELDIVPVNGTPKPVKKVEIEE